MLFSKKKVDSNPEILIKEVKHSGYHISLWYRCTQKPDEYIYYVYVRTGQYMGCISRHGMFDKGLVAARFNKYVKCVIKEPECCKYYISVEDF